MATDKSTFGRGSPVISARVILAMCACVLASLPRPALADELADEEGTRASETQDQASAEEPTGRDARGDTYNVPNRSGVTAGLTVGLSHVVDQRRDGDIEHGFAAPPQTLTFGYFVSSDIALQLILRNASYLTQVDDELSLIGLSLVGGELQWWLDDEFSIGLGAGAGAVNVLAGEQLTEAQRLLIERSGWGLSVRGSYAFGVWEWSALKLNVGVLPVFYNDGVVLGTTLGFEWQLY